MQPVRRAEPLAEAAPATIALDAARLLGGLPAQDGALASSTMIGFKEKPFEPPPPPQGRAV